MVLSNLEIQKKLSTIKMEISKLNQAKPIIDKIIKLLAKEIKD